jgi:hypothetical protein|nr:MAG TPA: N BRO family, N-terminal domain [Caudoviricetes sp.]DAZ32419.1 MAG TPA: N BRO family, N-terminal domain [Caudoviricetes sp.]
MNELMIFKNEEFGQIRTVEIDGKPYFVGKDIPAGEYKVSAANGGYYEVTANSTGDLGTIIANDNFEGEVYLTVQDGQYLKLSRAQIVAQ